MLKLYGVIRTRSNRPHWALEEIGAPYEFYQLDFSKGDNRSTTFLKLNPAGKMPVLEDEGLIITESGAICTYLAEKFPEKNLIPSKAEARAKYHQWMSFILTELEQPLWTMAKHTFALPEEKRVAAIKATAAWEFERAAALLGDGLGKRTFMIGDTFSMVDILAAHTLRWACNAKCTPQQTNLIDYLARMEARPAYSRMLASQGLPFPR